MPRSASQAHPAQPRECSGTHQQWNSVLTPAVILGAPRKGSVAVSPGTSSSPWVLQLLPRQHSQALACPPHQLPPTLPLAWLKGSMSALFPAASPKWLPDSPCSSAYSQGWQGLCSRTSSGAGGPPKPHPRVSVCHLSIWWGFPTVKKRPFSQFSLHLKHSFHHTRRLLDAIMLHTMA